MARRFAITTAAALLLLAACSDPTAAPGTRFSSRAALDSMPGDTSSPDTTSPPDTILPPPDTILPPPDTLQPPDSLPPDSTPPLVPVARVDLRPDAVTLRRGETVVLRAFLFDRRGRPLTGRPIGWAVGDSSVAVVDSIAGPFIRLRAVRRGRTTVTAFSGGKSDRSLVTVRR